MIFHVDQRALLKARARSLLLKLEEYQLHKEEWRIDFLREALEEACSMGHAIAMDEVHSTPWEYLITHLFRDTGRGTRETAGDVINARAAEGWEPWGVCGPENKLLMMRRRKGAA